MCLLARMKRLIMTINFSSTSIFCDDIRHEQNGKISLMGIYNGEMYVPAFPITLPKICSYFELRVPPDVDVNLDAILTVMKGPDKINSITITIPSKGPEVRIMSHGKPCVHMRAVGAMEFPSITFTEPTLLEVIAQIDGKTVIAGRLWITTFPEDESQMLDEKVD